MPTYLQTDDQRDELRRLLLEWVEGRTTGPTTARFGELQDLIDYGTITLQYPESMVKSVINELSVQRLLRTTKDES